ncbi:RHS repeat-associated core domain-containing protein [Pseudomonas mosselii]|uniref:RHS repeat-associated core domain-containing protein n=1 Tax=Pseudomonas mosselii TaxID=78327 RepID=UPI00216248D2|nr:RHS repeat-associated core domain-containing protein [Pseudomonas mosselii]MDH1103688.1 RHS repeat-associated core domain-containing protein [Pseudomonas mosselii]UVN43612.1 RHS repeat-associated core domain-containing protein [Pseudomonas mosselii]
MQTPHETLRANSASSKLLLSDRAASILDSLDEGTDPPRAYTPFGHHQGPGGASLGFTGTLTEASTGHYLLGNGYRAFNPLLMRFNAPDSWSPFGAGGLNAYAYCKGDPINLYDPSGHGPNGNRQAGLAVREILKRAPAGKQELDALINRVSGMFGAKPMLAPPKTNPRARQKFKESGTLNDAARGTIVTEAQNIPSMTNMLASHGAEWNQVSFSDGYRGTHLSLKTQAGVTAEIQLHVPGTIYAMLPPAVSRDVLGEDTFARYDRHATAAGFHAGEAHELYELGRKMASAREETSRRTRQFFDHMRSVPE